MTYEGIKEQLRWIKVATGEIPVSPPYFATVLLPGGHRETILISGSSQEESMRHSGEVIAVRPVKTPDPYVVDTYKDAFFEPSPLQIAVWENKAREAEKEGKEIPKKPGMIPCKIPDVSRDVSDGGIYVIVNDNEVRKVYTKVVIPGEIEE